MRRFTTRLLAGVALAWPLAAVAAPGSTAGAPDAVADTPAPAPPEEPGG